MMKYAIILLILYLPTANAYVDPGSGSMMLQGLIALIGAVIVFIRNPIATLRRWINKIRRR